jgi:hypothetical protein
MDSATLFLITVVTAMIIGYFAVKKHWKIADLF